MKIPLGLWEGSTENATVATALLADLVARGPGTTQGVLCVLDSSKALRRAVRDVLGERSPVQRCIRHKERNILDHLPERDRALVPRRLRQAWAERDHGRALDRLKQLEAELSRSHPGAAASLREGMAETLTLTRLGISGPLTRTLASTNSIELMIECVRRTSRNVKRWQSGEMALRWTAAGMLEAERQFRRIIGYQQLATLALAIERDLAPPMATKEVVLSTRHCVVTARNRRRSSTTSGTPSPRSPRHPKRRGPANAVRRSFARWYVAVSGGKPPTHPAFGGSPHACPTADVSQARGGPSHRPVSLESLARREGASDAYPPRHCEPSTGPDSQDGFRHVPLLGMISTLARCAAVPFSDV